VTAIQDNDAQKTIDDLREEVREYLKNFPDVDDLVATGILRAVGGGWYEAVRGPLPDGLGKYMNGLRISHGKAQFKPAKLTKKLKALKDSL